MIRITKSQNIPQILAADGVTNTDALKASYTANPQQFHSGPGVRLREITRMQFDREIYGEENVKAQLRDDQHEKCCFCEAYFSENSYGDVEHFRPKTAYKKQNERRLTYPGYYWLAYDWNNLLFSCEKCNRKYKGNHFPLANEGTRVTNHTNNHLMQHENPLLINPVTENPEDHIYFEKEVPLPKNGSREGKVSIQHYGLKRMNNARLDHYNLIKALMVWRTIDPQNDDLVDEAVQFFNLPKQEIIDLIAEARRYFDSAAKDAAKFAACVRSNFPELPRV